MNRWLLALVLIASGAAPVAGADNALAVIDGCIHRLDPTVDVGYARVAERCPELTPSLASSPYAAWLPPDWNKPDNGLSVGGLIELRGLLRRPESPPAVRAPRITRLAPLLEQLHHDDTRQRGWWARFKQWLHEVFAPQPNGQSQGWLGRLLGSIDLSQTVMRVIVCVALLLLLLLVGAIIVNELRVAGLWRSPRHRGQHGYGSAQPATSVLSLRDLDRAGPEQQPHLLLQLIIRRLIELKWLPPARALTLRELERAARLRDQEDRERLAALAAACERARFAEHVAAPMLAAATVRGRELLASLEAPSEQTAGAG
jgi:hypothetical protein